MGNDCECCHKENNKNQENDQNHQGSKYNPEIIERNFNDYIFQDKILDFPLKKYDMNDPVFKSVKKEENKMLTNFYKSKKDDFKTQMTAYLMKQNLNFVNLLTNQIIINENGTKLMKQKIKSEIENVENKEDAQFKISNLTVLILGQAGTGKSTLVNNILFDGKEVAKENDVDIGTTAFIAPYKNPKVPYLQLVDSRGIQLDNAWSINNIGDTASNFIREKLAQTNFNDFVHCIWYCVKNQRFVDIEKNLLEDINKITTQEDGTKKIPVIIVLTKALEPDYIRVMKEYIKNKKKFDDVVDVVAKRITLVQGMSAERRGLDTLVDLTVKKCKENFNGDLKKVMMKNLTQHVRETLFANNSMIRDKIIRIMKRDYFVPIDL
jgi:predicted GTPase